MTSHFPTSGELSAFRRDIGRDTVPCATGLATPWYLEPDYLITPATDSEKRYGIGYRYSNDDDSERYPFDSERVNARHEASALRSRAYAADAPFALLAGDPGWEV
jgi:hypothetical protein